MYGIIEKKPPCGAGGRDMKAVLYGSHYGHTQKYAEAIARALGCEAFPANTHKEANIAGCDTGVFGGERYAGGRAGGG